MTGNRILDLLKSDVSSWNEWKREETNKKAFFSPGLSGADLRGTDLSLADLRYADLREADLRETQLGGTDLSYAKLRGANLTGMDFRKAHLHGADFHAASLQKSNFSGMSSVALFESDFSLANLSDADLSHADFSAEELLQSQYRSGNISFKDEAKAVVSGHFTVRAFSHGASFMDFYRGASFYRANLTNANLLYARLRGIALSEANLFQANLAGADLFDSSLENSVLRGATLHRANLFKTKLRGADLRQADLSASVLSFADCHSADLRKTNLQESILVNTNFQDADLSGASVFGISSWNTLLDGTRQTDLLVTPSDQAPVRVDDLEVAQFIYLLLNRQKLRKVINTVANKAVLILGRFGNGGIDLLQCISEKLREMEYLPILFDFARPDDRNYTETIKILAGLSRFVIVDLSGPSVPQELYSTIPHFKIPFVPILEKGSSPYSMFVDLLEYDWVLKPIVEFESQTDLLDKMTARIVQPAEKRLETRQHLLKELFGK